MSEREERMRMQMRARYVRPPDLVESIGRRIVGAFRVLMGRARAVPLETGPQWSEWSPPEPIDLIQPPQEPQP